VVGESESKIKSDEFESSPKVPRDDDDDDNDDYDDNDLRDREKEYALLFHLAKKNSINIFLHHSGTHQGLKLIQLTYFLSKRAEKRKWNLRFWVEFECPFLRQDSFLLSDTHHFTVF